MRYFHHHSVVIHRLHLEFRLHHLVYHHRYPVIRLGDTVLECYNCASKNAFVLGFVPASSSSVVVLLCRVCVETVPALKDMDWELGQWHPLVQDRKFLPWLIKVLIVFLIYGLNLLPQSFFKSRT